MFVSDWADMSRRSRGSSGTPFKRGIKKPSSSLKVREDKHLSSGQVLFPHVLQDIMFSSIIIP